MAWHYKDYQREQTTHDRLVYRDEELLKLLQGVVEGVLVERSAIETAAATYLEYYRHHLAAEEREVIPRAAQLLTPDDWAAVAAAPAGSDPLFGREFDSRYRELRRQIELEAQDPDTE